MSDAPEDAKLKRNRLLGRLLIVAMGLLALAYLIADLSHRR